jgi:hypothetical protein
MYFRIFKPSPTIQQRANSDRLSIKGKHQADLIALLLKDGAQMDRTILHPGIKSTLSDTK